MAIQHGTRPRLRSKKDYSYERTFGTTLVFPDNYNTDAGLTMPDQNADGFPMGCTGYTQADIATDEDKVVYDPSFTYAKTCFIENHPQNQGCLIENAIKSTQVYGVKTKTQTEQDALNNKRGKYFDVDKVGDYFDGIRSAIELNRRPVSVGTI